jgi:hypothetical protein
VHYNEATQRKINMNEVNFDILVNRIEETQHVLQNNARLVINRHVTAKAWLVGCYIVEYEQKGEDRAKYGDKLIKCLSQRLGGKNFSTTALKIYRQFYLAYPQIYEEVLGFIHSVVRIGQSVTDQLQLPHFQKNRIGQPQSAQFEENKNECFFEGTKPNLLFNKLSFTHLAALLPLSCRFRPRNE